MDSAWLVPLSLAFGVALGIGLTAVIVWAARRGHRAAIVTSQSIPDGIDQVIEVLDSVGVVLDPSNNVLKASPGALAMGAGASDASTASGSTRSRYFRAAHPLCALLLG